MQASLVVVATVLYSMVMRQMASYMSIGDGTIHQMVGISSTCCAQDKKVLVAVVEAIVLISRCYVI